MKLVVSKIEARPLAILTQLYINHRSGSSMAKVRARTLPSLAAQRSGPFPTPAPLNATLRANG